MSQFGTPGGASRYAPENDVYTVLAIIGFLFLVVALIYVGYRAQTMFGSVIPAPGG